MRAVIYARYSSSLQRDASIEDQLRLCRERIEREGWTLHATYTDRAMSGASPLRPGYQKLIEDARSRKFETVVAEALDRLSRDQEDIARLYKQLSFAGVKLLTLAEGEISELHVGLKGTMNALFLKDLASKIRRGQRGRIATGFSAGGLSYNRHTRERFGFPVNPHRFRDCAATSIAIEAPEHVGIILPVLGHARATTGERYYNQAQEPRRRTPLPSCHRRLPQRT